MYDTPACGGIVIERIIIETSTWTQRLANGYTGTCLKTAALSVLPDAEPHHPDNLTLTRRYI